MNCSRFRFLIQQWFDSPISPQDERMVLAHVESCDSCARFQHQLDQVIQSTSEVPLPDECLPSNLEALAKRIVVEIPQDKPGIMGIFQKIFPFLGGGASKPKQKPQKGKAPKGKGKQQQPVQEMDMDEEDTDHSGSMFPHRKKSLEDLPPSQQKPKKSAAATAEADEEMLATSTRLKSFQNKMQPQEDDQSKSQGLSLGTKFNMNIPERGGSTEDGPLTLAESIRRKVGEEQKAQVTSGQQPILDQGGFDNDSPFAPPPGQFNPQGQGFPPPQGFPQGGPMTGQWADASGMPAPQPAGNWGDPPVPGVGGDHDWKPNAPASDWQMAKPQAPGWSSGPQPGAAPSPSDSQGWSSQQDWNQPQQQQQQQQQAQPQGGWNAPPQPAPAGGDSWNTQQSSGTNWSNQAPKQANEWSGSQPNSSWNAQQGEPGGWSSTPQPDWNKQQTESGGWDAPQQPAQGGWNQPAAGGWSQPQPQPQPQPAQDQGGWSQPQPQPQPQPAQDQGGWSQPQPAQNSSWSAPQQGNSWPPTPVQQQPDQSWGKTSGDWAAGNQNQNNWNAPPQPQQQMQPPAPQPQQMQQQQTQEWANMAGQQPDWAQPGQTTTSPWSEAPQAPRQDNSDSWSEEGEQIQTGMWQAFTLAEPEIGGGNRGQMRPETQDVNRFEAPIQARNEDPASMAAAAAGKADPSLFDIPIQERMRMQQQQPQPQQQEPAQRWDVPTQQQQQPPAPPAPPAPAPGPAINKNSIMDRLNKVLGDDLAAMAGDAQQGGWNSAPPAPPAPPAAPRMAPPPAPAPMAPQPAPAPMAPQPAAAQASQFDIPIQERMRQQGGAPEPVAAASASSGLFKLDDKAIDKVFRDNLGVGDAGPTAAAPSAPAAPAAAVPPPAPPVPPPSPIAAPPPVPPAQPRMAPPVPPAVAQMGGPKISAIPARPEPAAVAAPAAAQAGAADQSSGLFKNLDDRAMDQIFTNLGVKEEVGAGVQPSAPMAHAAPPAPPVPPLGQAPARQAPPPPPIPPVAAQAPPPAPAAPGGWNQAPAPAPAPAAPAAPPLHPSQRGEGRGLLNVDDDAMDRIFEGLGVQEKPAPIGKANLSTAVSQVRAIADVPTPPQVSVPGISRLSREEVVAEATPGKIHQIGKFLLDQQDLAKIGRLTEQDLADAKVRVLTNEASEEINKLLEHIAGQPGVVGSVIVGHDGILIANSLPRDLDPETIGILSLGIYINTTNSTKQLGHNHLHQLVCSTPYGFLVIADFGGGILVTVSNDRATEKLIPLMRTITQLVAQA